MQKNFVEELKWRGMIQDIMPGTEEKLMEGPQAAYVGIDPTADSLHIGHLVRLCSYTKMQMMCFGFTRTAEDFIYMTQVQRL